MTKTQHIHEETLEDIVPTPPEHKKNRRHRHYQKPALVLLLLGLLGYLVYENFQLHERLDLLSSKMVAPVVKNIPDLSTLEEKLQKLELAVASMLTTKMPEDMQKSLDAKFEALEKKLDSRENAAKPSEKDPFDVFILSGILRQNLWQGSDIQPLLKKLKERLEKHHMFMGVIQSSLELLQTLSSQGYSVSDIYEIPADTKIVETQTFPSYLSWLQGFIKISVNESSDIPGIHRDVQHFIRQGKIDEAISLVQKHVDRFPSTQTQWEKWLKTAQMMQKANALIFDMDRALLEKIGEEHHD